MTARLPETAAKAPEPVNPPLPGDTRGREDAAVFQPLAGAMPLRSYRHVHFVGIGGIGMSALARLLLARGHQVSGSDLSPGEQGGELAKLGALVLPGHRPEHVEGADLVVVTSAARQDNPEIRAALKRRVPVVKRSELLAAVLNGQRGIAVAGTHGKTTTTALLGHVLAESGFDPTVLVGGESFNFGSNARIGARDVVVAEADEYDASFLRLRPELAVITNVEPDHLDFYGTLENLHEAFQDFLGAVTGAAVVSADDADLMKLARRAGVSLVTFGMEQGEWRAGEVHRRGPMTRFTVLHGGRRHECAMRPAGAHNVRNALAAIAAARLLGAAWEDVEQALATFRGVARRLETKGEAWGVLVVDDYAHHPTEIRATLAALKEVEGVGAGVTVSGSRGSSLGPRSWAPARRHPHPRADAPTRDAPTAPKSPRAVRVVFQPHTYSRTRALLDDFAAAFGDADRVYLLDIYPARETDSLGVSGFDLALAAGRHHSGVVYAETIERCADLLLEEVEPGDIVITMGAGDVHRLGPILLEGLRRR